MKYILRCKKYKTYLYYDKEGDKRYSADGEKAHKFNKKSEAERVKNKLKHPDRWDVIEIRECKRVR